MDEDDGRDLPEVGRALRPHVGADVLKYRERRPAPALRPFVECVWMISGPRVSSPRAAERVVPDGCPELIVHLGDPFARWTGGRWVVQPRAFLAGTLSRPWRLRAGRRVDTLGIRFRAGETTGILPLSMAGGATGSCRWPASWAWRPRERWYGRCAQRAPPRRGWRRPSSGWRPASRRRLPAAAAPRPRWPSSFFSKAGGRAAATLTPIKAARAALEVECRDGCWSLRR